MCLAVILGQAMGFEHPFRGSGSLRGGGGGIILSLQPDSEGLVEPLCLLWLYLEVHG